MTQNIPEPSRDRYTRHRSFFSEAGWQRLTSTTIVVAGVGGLGSHVLSSVVRLGPVQLQLWDPGILDEPDLNRQVLYTPADIGRRKVEVAAEVLSRINPEVEVTTHPEPITAERCDTVCASAQHVVFDCLDSFTARAELDAIRTRRGWTVFHGGVEGEHGQAVTFGPESAGYAGVFGPDYAKMAAAGKPILATTVAVIAAMQVGEFVHWCNGDGDTPLAHTMFVYDGHAMRSDRDRPGGDRVSSRVVVYRAEELRDGTLRDEGGSPGEAGAAAGAVSVRAFGRLTDIVPVDTWLAVVFPVSVAAIRGALLGAFPAVARDTGALCGQWYAGW